MAVKPVFKVAVDDAAFKEFQAAFDKYREDLEAQQAEWDKQNKKVLDFSDTFNKTIGRSTEALTGAAAASAKMAGHISDAAGFLRRVIEYAGVLTGIATGASLFGIDRLAQAGYSAQRSAAGLGVTPGEQAAFRLNYGPYVNGDSVLSNIAAARFDPSKQRVFSALGVTGQQNKSPAELAVEMAPIAKELFERFHLNPQMAQAAGLTDIYSYEDLIRLHNTSMGDLQNAARNYQNDRKDLELDPATQHAWTNLEVQFQRAGIEIERTFITALTPLAPQFGAISKAVSEAIKWFLNTERVKWAIDEAEKGLKWFANFLQSEDFHKDIESIEEYTKRFIDALGKVISFIEGVGGLFHQTPAADTPVTPGPGGVIEPPRGDLPPQSIPSRWHHGAWTDVGLPGAKQDPHMFDEMEKKAGLPPGTLWRIYGIESGYGQNPNAYRENAAHAMGPFQFIPETAADYDVVNRNDLNQSSVGAAHLMMDLIAKYHDIDKALAGYNWGPKGLDEDIKQHGTDWLRYAPKETQDYIAKFHAIPFGQGGGGMAQQPGNDHPAGPPNMQPTVHLNVTNSTGASIHASTNQLVQVQQ